MKTKVYRVSPRENLSIYYLVDAPNSWVAKWCGANLYNNEYTSFCTAKDMIVKRFRIKNTDNNTTVCF